MARRGLHISTDLTLPITAVTATGVVYGGKGMGKTNLGAVVVEELSANGMRWSVLDPMGVWWGMRYAADGRGKGVECLILGGAHGDIPIEPTGGAVVADLVVDENVNVIIDISRKANGEMWSIGERIRFMTEYGRRLFARQGGLVKGRRREPICQVIDEAARFIPQMIRAGQPELAMCSNIWSTIVEEGRNIGLGVLLLTQRSARLNKDVAELADVMLAFRTVGPNSIGAVVDWLGEHVSKQEEKAMIEQIRALPVGSCLVVSPGWLKVEKVVAIRHRHTFDSSATPKPGEAAKRVHGDGAKPNLHLYSERMRETIERAKEDSVPDLKKEVKRLREQLDKRPTTAPTAAAKPTVDPALKNENKELRAHVEAHERLAKRAAEYFTRTVLPTLENLKDQLEKLGAKVTLSPSVMPAPIPSAAPPPARSASPIIAVERFTAGLSAQRSDGAASELTGKAMQIAAIAAGYAQRREGIDKKLMAAILGVPTNGSFYNRLSDARQAGAIVTEGSTIMATPDGIAKYAGRFKAPESTEEVLALWLPKLPGMAKKILQFLVDRGGSEVTRQELADAMGVPTNGSFYNRLSEVRLTGLLVENGKNVAVNRELLFL